ncbi:MAG: GntR family transcriptional regulator [Alphaproteobacteria bacterium]|nr:GntR family transcriptional regulator [Alphaproteobacteria bacterium]MBU0796123.1 GntR family transcriptional regulator [Alphaproteobacteria bacterium]MBU0888494.1 GntR family transcriptional regulator [Alphaproteobacteria bacterium]MBU1813043.1 GntR family transcriptional regulator [Alphaproteobacteria bacterium]MBU2089907.1 GntR family transcriptional regulator [Alphaproteobacteria bacterium]
MQTGYSATETVDESDKLTGKRGEAVERVAQQIRDAIIAGRFAPGQRLITRELMADLGYGRGTIREALGRLAADGLLDLVPNQGAAVRRFSRQEMQDLFRIRAVLESLAAELAAERINHGDNRRQFQAMLDSVELNEMDSEAGFFGKNLTFHHTILKISGNTELQALLSRMQLPIIMLQVQNAMRTEQFRHSTREHQDIAAAILAGDPERARLSMEAHLRRSGGWVQTLPEKLFSLAR